MSLTTLNNIHFLKNIFGIPLLPEYRGDHFLCCKLVPSVNLFEKSRKSFEGRTLLNLKTYANISSDVLIILAKEGLVKNSAMSTIGLVPVNLTMYALW